MNKVILCGRTTKDTDIQMTTTGKKVCRFSLAVDDGKNEDGSRRTQFIDCEAWNQSAEFLERYVSKGTRILVEGRLNKRSYEKDGVKHYPTNVVCDRIEFADGTNLPQNEQTSVIKPKTSQTAQMGMDNGFGIPSNYGIDDSDLPF